MRDLDGLLRNENEFRALKFMLFLSIPVKDVVCRPKKLFDRDARAVSLLGLSMSLIAGDESLAGPPLALLSRDDMLFESKLVLNDMASVRRLPTQSDV